MQILTQLQPDKAGMETPPRSLWRDTTEDRERRLAKLDLMTIVGEIGVTETRQLLPKLGMVETFGLPRVTGWLDEIAATVGEVK
jgi:hypothetical protein